MHFRITGLPVDPFRPLFGLSDAALAGRAILRRTVDEHPGFPCRITMEDAAPGEIVLLLNHEHQPAASPYRSSHAIYVREGAQKTFDAVDEIPPVMRTRLLALRGFDAAGLMVDADVAQGSEVEPLIQRLLASERVAYIQAHNAKQGCYSGRIERA